MKVVICGGGNASLTMAALLGNAGQHEVVMYLSFKAEYDRLTHMLAKNTQKITLLNPDGSTTIGKPTLVTNDVNKAITNADVIVIPVPAFAHEPILREIAPYVCDNTLVGAFPGQGGFQFKASKHLPLEAKNITAFGVEKLQYNCRRVVDDDTKLVIKVFSYKADISVGAIPASKSQQVATTVNAIVPLLNLQPIDNYMGVSLACTNQCIHPSRMYGLFHIYDGVALSKPPLFYEEMDELSTEMMQKVSDEIQTIARALEKSATSLGFELSLANVLSVGDCLKKTYVFDDDSTLTTMMRTCTGFKGIGTPMARAKNGGYEPDYQMRYFTEDIPALCVTHGLGELVGVQTPTIDTLVQWAQPLIGKEYLDSDNRLTGKHVSESGAPQAYGITTMKQLLQLHSSGKM